MMKKQDLAVEKRAPHWTLDINSISLKREEVNFGNRKKNAFLSGYFYRVVRKPFEDETILGILRRRFRNLILIEAVLVNWSLRDVSLTLKAKLLCVMNVLSFGEFCPHLTLSSSIFLCTSLIGKISKIYWVLNHEAISFFGLSLNRKSCFEVFMDFYLDK